MACPAGHTFVAQVDGAAACCPDNWAQCGHHEGMCCDPDFAARRLLYAAPMAAVVVAIVVLAVARPPKGPRMSGSGWWALWNSMCWLLLAAAVAPICDTHGPATAALRTDGTPVAELEAAAPACNPLAQELVALLAAGVVWAYGSWYLAMQAAERWAHTTGDPPAEVIARTKAGKPRVLYVFDCFHKHDAGHATSSKTGTVPLLLDPHFVDLTQPVRHSLTARTHGTLLEVAVSFIGTAALERQKAAIQQAVDARWSKFDSHYEGHWEYGLTATDEADASGTFECLPHLTPRALARRRVLWYIDAALSPFHFLRLCLCRAQLHTAQHEVVFKVYAAGEPAGVVQDPTALATAIVTSTEFGDHTSARGTGCRRSSVLGASSTRVACMLHEAEDADDAMAAKIAQYVQVCGVSLPPENVWADTHRPSFAAPSVSFDDVAVAAMTRRLSRLSGSGVSHVGGPLAPAHRQRRSRSGTGSAFEDQSDAEQGAAPASEMPHASAAAAAASQDCVVTVAQGTTSDAMEHDTTPVKPKARKRSTDSDASATGALAHARQRLGSYMPGSMGDSDSDDGYPVTSPAVTPSAGLDASFTVAVEVAVPRLLDCHSPTHHAHLGAQSQAQQHSSEDHHVAGSSPAAAAAVPSGAGSNDGRRGGSSPVVAAETDDAAAGPPDQHGADVLLAPPASHPAITGGYGASLTSPRNIGERLPRPADQLDSRPSAFREFTVLPSLGPRPGQGAVIPPLPRRDMPLTHTGSDVAATACHGRSEANRV